MTLTSAEPVHSRERARYRTKNNAFFIFIRFTSRKLVGWLASTHLGERCCASTSAGVPRSYEPYPSLDPTVGLCLGSQGVLGGWVFLMSEVPLYYLRRVAHTLPGQELLSLALFPPLSLSDKLTHSLPPSFSLSLSLLHVHGVSALRS